MWLYTEEANNITAQAVRLAVLARRRRTNIIVSCVFYPIVVAVLVWGLL